MSRTRKNYFRLRGTGWPDWYTRLFYCSEPKWWRRMYKHRLRRAAIRKALVNVLQGRLDPDAAPWPQDKKPWRYYW